MAVRVRKATKADLDRVVEIHLACYPDSRVALTRKAGFVREGFGTFADMRVAEQDGHVVGHVFGFSIRGYFAGKAVPMLGVASLGVAPEARERGVARALLEHLHTEAAARGAVVSELFAFRHAFYQSHGYAEVTPMLRVACDPRAFPEAWVAAARTADLRAARKEDLEEVIACHRRVARRRTGWLDRPEPLWTRRLLNERLHMVVLRRKTRIVGYAIYEIEHEQAHAATVLDVAELAADDADAARTLCGFLGMQRGQIVEVRLEIAQDDPMLFALTDVDARRFGDERVEHELGGIVAGPMLRILDVPRALAARGYLEDGRTHVTVGELELRIDVKKGRARVTGGTSKDAVTCDVAALASIAFGGMCLRDAVALGIASGPDRAIERATALFRLPPFHTVDRF